ncbi:MAG: hypothetical protein HOL31_01900 [Candidatus Scalindua sp.]|nr:hypothetical protein [Candidatus Scalindua sp.]MBT7349705.1 hypothetical protein [candidate division WWE3 bacterium]
MAIKAALGPIFKAIGTAIISKTAQNIFTGVSATASAASGVSAQRAFNQEADLTREQGDLQRAEAEEEAIRLDQESKAKRKKVAMSFVKGGVTLAGTPLLLLETQAEDDEAFSGSVKKRGAAQQRLAFKKGEVLESRGRAALIGGIGQSAGTLATGFA